MRVKNVKDVAALASHVTGDHRPEEPRAPSTASPMAMADATAVRYHDEVHVNCHERQGSGDLEQVACRHR